MNRSAPSTFTGNYKTHALVATGTSQLRGVESPALHASAGVFPCLMTMKNPIFRMKISGSDAILGIHNSGDHFSEKSYEFSCISGGIVIE
jgi:hypothetical protein